MLSALSGCVSTVDYPHPASGAATANGPDFAAVMAYIEDARGKLVGKLRQGDQLHAAAKIGVGGGIAGAGAAAAFGARPKVVLGALTVAGLAYSVDTASDTATASQILTAGLGNLDCVESAGEQANALFVSQQYAFSQKRAILISALQQLETDIRAANSAPADYASELPAARQSLSTGWQALGAIDYFASHNPVAGAMLRAARSTITEVNQQLRERSPSIAAIAQSGSILGTFLSTGAGVGESARAAANKITAKASAHAAGRPYAERLIEDQNALRAALDSVGDLTLPQTSATSVSACKVQFAAEAPMALAFTSPVDLAAGATRDLSVLSRASVRPQWASSIPADVNWSQELGVLSLSAHADAKAASYRLRLVDYSGHMSDEFALNVTSAPTAGGGTQSGATPPQGPAGTPANPGQRDAAPPKPPGGH